MTTFFAIRPGRDGPARPPDVALRRKVAVSLRETKPHHAERDGYSAGFTLIELLITMLVIAILAAVSLAGLFAAQEAAKAARTKGTISKLHNQVMHTWESYRTRRLPISIQQGEQPRAFAARKLSAMWELQRMEMPDAYEDIFFNPVTPGLQDDPMTGPRNALRAAYRERVPNSAAAGVQNASAECLYLIVTLGMNADDEVRFLDGEVGDTDNDNMLEFLDGWGRPISWLRWAPGYLPVNPEYNADFADTDFQIARIERDDDGDDVLNASDTLDPDPFDPAGVGRPGAQAPSVQPPAPVPGTPETFGFKLVPLIYSAGPDGEFGIFAPPYDANDSNEPARRANPYSLYPNFPVPPPPLPPPPNGAWRGTPHRGVEGGGHADNITNHRLGNR